jgi:hypothetical protein
MLLSQLVVFRNIERNGLNYTEKAEVWYVSSTSGIMYIVPTLYVK